MEALERLHDSDKCSGREITGQEKEVGGLRWAAGCIFDRLIHCKPCSGSLTKHLFRENKMSFVNKSSCISIMKSFSSTIVKDILSSPLGEDSTEEEEWPRAESHRLSLEKERRRPNPEMDTLPLAPEDTYLRLPPAPGIPFPPTFLYSSGGHIQIYINIDQTSGALAT